MIVVRFLDGTDPMEGYHYNVELSIYDYFIYLISFNLIIIIFILINGYRFR